MDVPPNPSGLRHHIDISDVGQVREVAPGTYKIGVSGGAGSVVFGSHEAAEAAVSQAGQYCHAKGQKLVIAGALS
jgi:hypothetical protein